MCCKLGQEFFDESITAPATDHFQASSALSKGAFDILVLDANKLRRKHRFAILHSASHLVIAHFVR